MAYVTRDACPDACVRVDICHVGSMGNNCYIIANRENPDACFVVDPGFESKVIIAALAGRTPQAIVLSHYHFDHTGGAAELRRATGAPVWASAADAAVITGEHAAPKGMWEIIPCDVDRTLEDGETVDLAGVAWTCLLTPGHSPGSMCLFAQGNPQGTSVPVLIAGDTLFDGNIGRTDFADGNHHAMMVSLARLRTLPQSTHVLTGHDSLTTIGGLSRVFSYYVGAAR